MASRAVKVTTIGKIAQEALAQARQASVLGNTSHGAFLRLSSGWVIFLSLEPQRGPLTLNLQGEAEALESLEVGSTAGICSDNIHFPSIGLSFRTDQAQPWQAPAPPQVMLPPPQRREQLLSIPRQASFNPAANSLVSSSLVLLGAQDPSNPTNAPVYHRLKRLLETRQNNQIAAMADGLAAFLGLGAGLTPSGDDLICGFLLAANRWGEQLSPGLNVAELNQQVLEQANLLTNKLSANLIACASRGQADERLILALDGIITGTPDARACAAALASWGSSSGFDAWVGMALFLAPQIQTW